MTLNIVAKEPGRHHFQLRNVVSSGPDAAFDVGIAGSRRTSPTGLGTPALRDGISVMEAGTVRVANNGVDRLRAGINIRSTGRTRVAGNRVRNAFVGIVAGSTGARYVENAIRRTQTGIFAQATGQVLRDNVLSQSSRMDCRDETTSAGTLGTGNTWSGNVGAISYPVGICGDTAPDIWVTFNVGMAPAVSTAAVDTVPATIGGLLGRPSRSPTLGATPGGRP